MRWCFRCRWHFLSSDYALIADWFTLFFRWCFVIFWWCHAIAAAMFCWYMIYASLLILLLPLLMPMLYFRFSFFSLPFHATPFLPLFWFAMRWLWWYAAADFHAILFLSFCYADSFRRCYAMMLHFSFLFAMLLMSFHYTWCHTFHIAMLFFISFSPFSDAAALLLMTFSVAISAAFSFRFRHWLFSLIFERRHFRRISIADRYAAFFFFFLFFSLSDNASSSYQMRITDTANTL